MLPPILLSAAATGLLSAVLTIGLVTLLRRRGMLDRPNERSLHTVPTPRGGGWAILVAFAAGCAWQHPTRDEMVAVGPVIGGAVLLVVISARDDRRALGPLPRFAAQVAAVVAGMFALPGNTFQGLLPSSVDAALTGFAWLWFINLFNFMDGMDGLAGGEAVAISVGIYLVSPELAPWAALLAAAALGFLVWNWAPARLFLGDVGSIPLGYLLGAMLLRTAQRGDWAASLILPSYFLADATLTLLKRAARREKVWQAHRQHFYQRAVQGGRTHREVASWVMVANAALVACAAAVAPTRPLVAIALGATVVTALMGWMNRKATAS